MIKTIYDRYFPQLLGAMCGNLIADIMCYPLSTIVGRLILQGTRTIIDDTETGNILESSIKLFSEFEVWRQNDISKPKKKRQSI